MTLKKIFFCCFYITLIAVNLIYLVIAFADPLYLVSKNKLNITDTLKERLCVVIASNRENNTNLMRNRLNSLPIRPYSLEKNNLSLTNKSKEDIIKIIHTESIRLCDKTYCMIVEDDIVFIYKDLEKILFDNIISYNNDNNYVFDCSKKGFLRMNYVVNGNGACCRIYSRYAIKQILTCLPSCNNPVDICIATCLKGFEEKRFLFTQHAGAKSSRW